jgi:circadian clock protein KaiB
LGEKKEVTWELRLYIAGNTRRSVEAVENIKKICENQLAGKYNLKVIDLLQNPRLAKGDQIFATPTLVKRLPLPLRKYIGDLSDTEKVLVGFDLKPREE